MTKKWIHAFVGGTVLATLMAQPAFATNILAFGTPGRPDQYSWQQFYGETQNASHSYSLLNIWSYYTPTGFTGTTRDQFQFSLRGTVGYTSPNTNQTGIGVSTPGISAQYYYNVVEPGKTDKMDPSFRTFWTNPQITLNFPNGNHNASGFGNGGNQWQLNLQDNNYIAFGRLGISINPISATYLFRDDAKTTGATTEVRRGLNVTLLDTAVGWWFTPNLIAGVQGQYNENAISHSDLHRSTSARVGPAFTYLGFKEYGFFIAGNAARDFHDTNFTNNARKNNVFQLWIQKYFKGA